MAEGGSFSPSSGKEQDPPLAIPTVRTAAAGAGAPLARGSKALRADRALARSCGSTGTMRGRNAGGCCDNN